MLFCFVAIVGGMCFALFVPFFFGGFVMVCCDGVVVGGVVGDLKEVDGVVLAGIIRHMWAYSRFSNFGFDVMSDLEKRVFCSVVCRPVCDRCV